MFFSTKSKGAKRLSLILGIISGCYFTIYQHVPTTSDSGERWSTIGLNLANMAILFAVGFVAAWTVVRVIAWIIEGFLCDRKQGE